MTDHRAPLAHFTMLTDGTVIDNHTGAVLLFAPAYPTRRRLLADALRRAARWFRRALRRLLRRPEGVWQDVGYTTDEVEVPGGLLRGPADTLPEAAAAFIAADRLTAFRAYGVARQDAPWMPHARGPLLPPRYDAGMLGDTNIDQQHRRTFITDLLLGADVEPVSDHTGRTVALRTVPRQETRP